MVWGSMVSTIYMDAWMSAVDLIYGKMDEFSTLASWIKGWVYHVHLLCGYMDEFRISATWMSGWVDRVHLVHGWMDECNVYNCCMDEWMSVPCTPATWMNGWLKGICVLTDRCNYGHAILEEMLQQIDFRWTRSNHSTVLYVLEVLPHFI